MEEQYWQKTVQHNILITFLKSCRLFEWSHNVSLTELVNSLKNEFYYLLQIFSLKLDWICLTAFLLHNFQTENIL